MFKKELFYHQNLKISPLPCGSMITFLTSNKNSGTFKKCILLSLVYDFVSAQFITQIISCWPRDREALNYFLFCMYAVFEAGEGKNKCFY